MSRFRYAMKISLKINLVKMSYLAKKCITDKTKVKLHRTFCYPASHNLFGSTEEQLHIVLFIVMYPEIVRFFNANNHFGCVHKDGHGNGNMLLKDPLTVVC